MNMGDRKCYHCDKPGFTRQHMNDCPAENFTFNFCKSVCHFDRMCRAKKNNRGRSSVGMIQGQDGQELFESEGMEDDASQHEISVGWENTPQDCIRSWDSVTSKDYMVMAIRSKKNAELKVVGAKLSIKINGRKTTVWIDSGSLISLFTIGELRKTLGAAGINLQEVGSKDHEFRDYGNNPNHLPETMKVELVSNVWATSASIKVIGGNRPSIIGSDLMSELGLQLLQKAPDKQVMSIQDENAADDKFHTASTISTFDGLGKGL